MPRQQSTAKKKQGGAVETSESIDAQIKEFLKGGGHIEVIESGVSGQESMAKGKYAYFPKKEGH